MRKNKYRSLGSSSKPKPEPKLRLVTRVASARFSEVWQDNASTRLALPIGLLDLLAATVPARQAINITTLFHIRKHADPRSETWGD